MSEVKIGQPVMLMRHGGESVYGRVLDFDGGSMRLVTPGKSVLLAGCAWFRILDDAGMERLRKFEALADEPYGGLLTHEQMSIDRYGKVDPQPASLHRFYFKAMALARTTGWRYGQAMFNHLLDVRPDLAERVRGTDADPFHCVSPNSERFDRFVALIESEWTKSAQPSDI